MKKQHMKKALVSALAFVMVFGLAACGGKSSNKSKHDADTISVCIASEPETMDPARNSTVDVARTGIGRPFMPSKEVAFSFTACYNCAYVYVSPLHRTASLSG